MSSEPAASEYEIVSREDFSDVTYLLEVRHPRMARAARPGQFVIVMSRPEGERIPLTIADFDRDKGTITLVIQAVGKTTREMRDICRVGTRLHALVGPMAAGVYAGDPSVMSRQSCFPKVAMIEQQFGGLLRGMLAMQEMAKARGQTGPQSAGPTGVLWSFGEGTAELFLSGEGTYVITSSRDDERSWESDRLQNGYFTHFLIEALKSSAQPPTVREVFDRLSAQVTRTVAKEKGVGQHPQIHPTDDAGEVRIGVVPRLDLGSKDL